MMPVSVFLPSRPLSLRQWSGVFVFFLFALSATAQPPARQREAAKSEKNNSSRQQTAKHESIREFPVAKRMPEDVAWRRDVYRRIDLTKDANAPLYFPITPTKERENLFVRLFRLILRGQIKAYEYTADMNEHFDEAHVVKAKKIMDDNRILYEAADGRMRVNDADLPSEDVKAYFLKESVYYDQHAATFRTKVTALCPVIVSGSNEFGESDQQQIPLFWVNYEEAAPHLAKLSLMGSNYNNAALITADDYFTTNRYQGDIYKTTNLQDRIIAQYAPTDSARTKESQRIEQEMRTFEKKLWGDGLKVNRPDSTQMEQEDADDIRRRTATSAAQTTKVKSSKSKSSRALKVKTPKASSSKSTAPRLSVRRQRR
ncbi:MAG: gliding motility protein GldN [Bacteroidales bacterium]|nr:gliding motility protein GldN [Bacteroidales bacterium]